MKIRDLYEKLKASIEQAASQKVYDIPIILAEANGFTKIETSPTSLAFECTYLADDGAIRLVYRSWDPSGPFQNLPDINRYFLTLYEKSDHFSMDYPD